MRIQDIPASVSVNTTAWADTYQCNSAYNSTTFSWYATTNNNTFPHVTVGSNDNVTDTVPTTQLDGTPSSLTKPWWFKLHVSVDIHGRNLQMYYKIDANWHVSPCGNTLQHIPSHNKAEAQQHANRQGTDYKAFAQAFVNAARTGWINDVVARNSPRNLQIGPQTVASFGSSDGL